MVLLIRQRIPEPAANIMAVRSAFSKNIFLLSLPLITLPGWWQVVNDNLCATIHLHTRRRYGFA
jgi:hypothetical protein